MVKQTFIKYDKIHYDITSGWLSVLFLSFHKGKSGACSLPRVSFLCRISEIWKCILPSQVSVLHYSSCSVDSHSIFWKHRDCVSKFLGYLSSVPISIWLDKWLKSILLEFESTQKGSGDFTKIKVCYYSFLSNHFQYKENFFLKLL